MADIRNVEGWGDNPIVNWDDGARIPLLRSGSLWVPSEKHRDKGSSSGGSGDSGGSGNGGVTITAAMIKAGCDAGGYDNPTYHNQGGYAGVAKLYNDAIAKVHHGPMTKKQAACLVGEDIQETGGMYYWEEAGGPFRYDPYRGRGYTQLTWQDNYADFGRWCKKYGAVSDAGYFVAKPTAVATLDYVALTSIWEFDGKYSGKTLWQIADASSSPWHRVSRAINTGNPDASFPANGEALRAKVIDAVLKVTPDPTPASGGGGGAQKPRDDYPYRSDSWQSVDPWGFYKRECVSFCCWRVRQRSRYSSFSNSWKTHWGNGGEWIGAAHEAGIGVFSSPKVGDVACRTSGRAGHVAWVYTVNGSKFAVEEYNHNWSNGFGHVYDTRDCTPGTSGSNGFAGFIRFGLK